MIYQAYQAFEQMMAPLRRLADAAAYHFAASTRSIRWSAT